ncbi:hypothetical protein ABTC31_20020 [Acinetobacter baumannii]
MPKAVWPRARATASTVPDPIIGSSTRIGSGSDARMSSEMPGAILAGKGWTGSRSSIS